MKRILTTTTSTTTVTQTLFGRFRRDEEGGMIIFSLFMFVLILAMGGMAVDLMRYETTRAKLVGTNDRAVLAAADLDQTLSPAEVVRDYYTKSGLIDYLDGEPVVDEGINYRVVTASGRAEIPTFFFGLPNFLLADRDVARQSLVVRSSSTAEERVTDVEVSLVLDVSGSMNSNNRIQNLRPAARDFVTTVLANNTNAPQGLITISMVPYSAVVNPGTEVVPFLTNITRSHEYSTCPLFDDAMFTTTELNLNGAYEHVSHFDPDWFSPDPSPIADPWCHTGDHNAIIAVTSDEQALHDAIDDLEPYGNTAIDMGMKWGTALLDPSTRTMVTSLAAAPNTSVEPVATGRPYGHDEPEVLKVIVVMTDGFNTQQYDLQDRFKYGQSFVWFNLDYAGEPLNNVHQSDYSIQFDGLQTPTIFSDDRFYTHQSSSSQRVTDYPDGFSSNADYAAAVTGGSVIPRDHGQGPIYAGNVLHASWQDMAAVWEHNRINNAVLSRAYNARAIPWSAGTVWSSGHSGPSQLVYLPDFRDADAMINYSLVDSTEANSRLSEICAAAQAEDIVVYTVAFEAPSSGQAALQDCASSPSRYFDVNGTDISAAFSAIATDIRSLKLTQ